MKNILVLSAGRRVELVKCFKNSIVKLGLDCKLIAVDISKTAPALYFADSYFIIKRINDFDYINNLIDICVNANVGCIIPTIDTELKVLADNRELIEIKTGAKIMLSSQEFVDTMRDKKKATQYFIEKGFYAPKYFERLEEITKFPVFIKPLDGSSSINAYKINTKNELEFFSRYIKSPIIQEYIDGKEYSVDVFCDFQGNPITIVPRERIATRAGEVLKGKIEKNRLIIDEIKKFISIAKPIGHITIQGIVFDGKFYFIEINARFGGGAPMSFYVGADSTENILRLLNGEKLGYKEDYEDNVLFSRFDDCIRVDL